MRPEYIGYADNNLPLPNLIDNPPENNENQTAHQPDGHTADVHLRLLPFRQRPLHRIRDTHRINPVDVHRIRVLIPFADVLVLRHPDGIF